MAREWGQRSEIEDESRNCRASDRAITGRCRWRGSSCRGRRDRTTQGQRGPEPDERTRAASSRTVSLGLRRVSDARTSLSPHLAAAALPESALRQSQRLQRARCPQRLRACPCAIAATSAMPQETTHDVEQALLDRVGDRQALDRHGMLLAESVHALKGLVLDGRRPDHQRAQPRSRRTRRGPTR